MFYCPVGGWVIEQHALIVSATEHYPTVYCMYPTLYCLPFLLIKVYIPLTRQRQRRCVSCWSLHMVLHFQLNTPDPASIVVWLVEYIHRNI